MFKGKKITDLLSNRALSKIETWDFKIVFFRSGGFLENKPRNFRVLEYVLWLATGKKKCYVVLFCEWGHRTRWKLLLWQDINPFFWLENTVLITAVFVRHGLRKTRTQDEQIIHCVVKHLKHLTKNLSGSQKNQAPEITPQLQPPLPVRPFTRVRLEACVHCRVAVDG